MIKSTSKLLLATSITAFMLIGCNNYDKSLQVLPNELAQADECKNNNKEYQNDCYDLISYKNSIALLRLGIKDYANGNYDAALKRYSLAKVRGNFYANALLANLYLKGKGVKQNTKQAIELLEDVEDVDPIAAYKLAFHYIAQKDYDDAIELLTFASKNNVKEAQYELAKIYKEGEITKVNLEKSQALEKAYEDKNNSFISAIYGI